MHSRCLRVFRGANVIDPSFTEPTAKLCYTRLHMTLYLDEDDVKAVHLGLVEMFGGQDPIDPPGVRDENLLSSALMRPQTGGFGGPDKYRAVEQKAAALLHSLIMNHAFHNGNKRTALVSTIVFLDRNNRVLTDVSDDELFNLVIDVASGNFPSETRGADDDTVVQAIGEWLRERTAAKAARVSDMSINDFLRNVESSGGRYKTSGGSYVIFGPIAEDGASSVRISQTTKTLTGHVVRSYLTRLGLSEGQSGIAMYEFLDGLPPNKAAMRRFRNVLHRLADA